MGKSHSTNRFLALKMDSLEGEAPPPERDNRQPGGAIGRVEREVGAGDPISPGRGCPGCRNSDSLPIC